MSSSFKFIDYLNISSLSAMGFFNATIGPPTGQPAGVLMPPVGGASSLGYGTNGSSSTGQGLSANFSASSVLLNASPASLFNLTLDFGLDGPPSSGVEGGGGAGGSFASFNSNHPLNNYVQKEFIFDRKDVRVIFITLYSLVFCCCFFGKYNKKVIKGTK